ncbi:MAG: GNAT family N-acetyltransferase [Cyclobacteriaceae bacterium]|nr:GNAT family N-acetyltransferase [Cyclobacteriaceae bacterium]
MEIRPSQKDDIPAIVELLKLSLGETLMPKSEAFWQWKHLDNPFGKSPVLLAFEGGQLIGVRAFMRWEWKHNDKIYKAVRAVDTATHPKHQGKGIFKMLTLELVRQCQDEGVDFIFNTPNSSSRPGYLKMGWQELGKLKVYFRPVLNFSTKATADFESCYSWDPELAKVVQVESSPSSMITNYLPGFLNWRYGMNPNVRYYLAHNEGGGHLLIFRLKKHRFGTEFRVVDFIRMDENSKRYSAMIRAAIRDSGAHMVTTAGNYIPDYSIPVKAGPLITVRPLNMHKPLSLCFWKPSLGDIEVF